jgi:oligopeptide/dipeptide ABC transporter ATP-binding protein
VLEPALTPLAELVAVSVLYRRGGRETRALTEIDLRVERGETLAIVGGSGCGKTTIGRALLMLQPPSEGAVRYEGVDLTTLRPRALRRCRARMQMVFQDPFASLNPHMTIGETLGEPLIVHRLARRWRDTREPVALSLRRVGLDPACASRMPHEFSGGQRQRIAIARAMMTQPDLVVADEPLSALDITLQGQILELLAAIRSERGLTLVLISHDLPVVRRIADRAVVVFDGHIVEEGPPAELFVAPAHPYTAALVRAVPVPDPARGRLDLARPVPTGDGRATSAHSCVFLSRCPQAHERCETKPPLRKIAPRRRAACWLNEEYA